MYFVSVYIHILSAIFWIGGMMFTVAVLVPISRHKIIESNRGTFFKIVGEKFSRISWILFLILIITGITNLTTRGFELTHLLSAEFWQGGFGHYLGTKLLIFAVVLIISGTHDFYFGPKAAQLMDSDPDSPQTHTFRKITSWLGRINLLFGLMILYYAIRVVRG